MWMCWQQQVTEGISVSLAQILDSQVTDGEPDDEIGEYTVALERGYGREKNMLDGLVAFDFCGSWVVRWLWLGLRPFTADFPSQQRDEPEL
jgi:hypothetical protein